MARNDVHRPSCLVPTDYEFVLAFAYPGSDEPGINLEQVRYLRDSQKFFSPKRSCHVCGAQFRYGSVFFHHPSQEYLEVGWECAEQIDACSILKRAREGVLSALKKVRAKLVRSRYLKKSTRELRVAFWKSRKNSIVKDIRDFLGRKGALSAAQIALVLRIERQRVERENRPTELKVPAPEGGRLTVVGEIVSVRREETQWGWATKITVKVTTESGIYLVWSSAPAALGVVTVGDSVEFVANLKRSDRDQSFCFASRPTKAKKLAKQTDGEKPIEGV